MTPKGLLSGTPPAKGARPVLVWQETQSPADTRYCPCSMSLGSASGGAARVPAETPRATRRSAAATSGRFSDELRHDCMPEQCGQADTRSIPTRYLRSRVGDRVERGGARWTGYLLELVLLVAAQ